MQIKLQIIWPSVSLSDKSKMGDTRDITFFFSLFNGKILQQTNEGGKEKKKKRKNQGEDTH